MIKRSLFSCLLAPVTILALATVGCGGHGISHTTDPGRITVGDDQCFLPGSLAKDDSDKTRKFGAEVSTKLDVASAKADVDLSEKLKTEFPNAGDVNRIYALSYAACLSCRINKDDHKACVDLFTKIFEKDAGKIQESEATKNAMAYYKQVFPR